MDTLTVDVLSVRVLTGFPPFAFYRDGEIVGFDIDILRSFAQSAGLELSLSPTEQFEGIWFSPADGHVDLAAAGIARFEERLRDDLMWSTPYYDVRRSVLIHQDQSAELRTIGDFRERSIAFVRGSTADLDTRARAPAQARLVPIQSQADGMAQLMAGEIDGLAMGAPSNGFHRQFNPQFTLIDVHEFSQPEGLRFPAAASSPLLLDSLNRFIREARAGNEIATYIEKWEMQNAI